jgi:hypothetical protein
MSRTNAPPRGVPLKVMVQPVADVNLIPPVPADGVVQVVVPYNVRDVAGIVIKYVANASVPELAVR